MEIIEQSTKDWLNEQLGAHFQIEKHTYSNQDDVYKIQVADKNFYLKTNLSLKSEHDNILRLQPYLSVPKIIGFTKIADKDHLLMTEVLGDNLAELVGTWSIPTIIQEFTKAVKRFHTLSVADIFPESNSPPNSVVLHGDMGFLNIIFAKHNSPGYIDLGRLSIGNPDIDLADAIWSLQRNIGPSYGEQFLKEYGDVVMTEKIDKALKFRYSA